MSLLYSLQVVFGMVLTGRSLYGGGIHALLFIPLLVVNRNRVYTNDIVAHDRKLPTAKEVLQMTVTYLLVTFAWIFFRAPSVKFAFDYIHHIGYKLTTPPSHRLGLIYVLIPILIDWQQRRSERNVLSFKNTALRWGMYIVLGITVLIYSVYNQAPFIYFQF